MKKFLTAIYFGIMISLIGCQKNNSETIEKTIGLFSDVLNSYVHIDGVKIEFHEKESMEINTFEELIDSLSLEDSPYRDIFEGCEEMEYGYYDVNDDGVDELIFNSVRGVKIFMYLNDEIQMVCNYSYSNLLENGMVWYHRPGGAPENDIYQCLVFDGEKYQEVFYISRYDDNQDGVYAEDGTGDKYYYKNYEETPDAGIYDKEISKSEYEKILQPYLEYQEAELHGTGVIVNNFYK